jgi:hypothetical protein
MLTRIISASVFGLVMTVGGGEAVVSCTPAQVAIIDSQIPADGLGDVECVAAQLLQGGLTDPMQILTQCGSLLVSQLITLAEDLLAIPSVASDGGVTASAFKPKVLPAHLALVPLTDTQRSRIQAIHDAALKLVDGGV